MNSKTAGRKTEIPTSEYVYVTLTAITAGLSIFGGTAMCILHFAFKDIKTPGRQLLLYLAFSNALLAFGNLLGVIWYLYRDSVVINRSEVYCDFQSAMTIYFSITSFSWTVIMAVCLFVTVVLGKTRFTETYMVVFHLLSWIPGGIIIIIALSLGVLGTDTTLETASWCWIDPRTPHTLLWQFVTGKFMEVTAYITTVVLYAAIKVFLSRQTKKKLRMTTRKKGRNDVINEANRKLTFVPFVFIVCRIWGTLRFLIGNFGQSIVNEPYVTWINPLQGIGDSAQGIANFVLYCYSTETIRRRMLGRCARRNRIADANTSRDIDSTSALPSTSTSTKKSTVVPVVTITQSTCTDSSVQNPVITTHKEKSYTCKPEEGTDDTEGRAKKPILANGDVKHHLDVSTAYDRGTTSRNKELTEGDVGQQNHVDIKRGIIVVSQKKEDMANLEEENPEAGAASENGEIKEKHVKFSDISSGDKLEQCF